MGIIYNEDGTIREQWDDPVIPGREPKPKSLTFNEFIGLAIMVGEMDDELYADARDDRSLRLYFDLLEQAQGIDRDNPMIARGGARFVAQGLLTQQGWDAMLTHWPMVE